MDVLHTEMRQRYELKITGRLSMDNDGSESEVIFFLSSAAHRSEF